MRGLLAKMERLALAGAMGMGLAACSSGSGSDGPLTPPPNSSSSSSSSSSTSSSSSSGDPTTVLPAPLWQQGLYEPPETYANICANPATRKHPLDGSLITERAGTEMHEKMWLRSFADQYYLWYDLLPDVDPTPLEHDDYFYGPLQVDKDAFSDYNTFAEVEDSQSGISTDLGVDLAPVSFNGGAGLVVYYVEPGSANASRLARGDLITAINDTPLTEANLFDLAREMFEREPGDSLNVTLRRNGTAAPTTVTVSVARTPRLSVPITKLLEAEDGPVGYLLFNLNNNNAEAELIEAIDSFKTRNISDLIVDLRYNVGGYIYVAAQLAYMIAGAEATEGADFYRMIFNDRHPDTQPFTGAPLEPFGFIAHTVSPDLGTDSPLPSLDLKRVFVLTTAQTCSASEALINGLNGIGTEVIQIGTTTCGKPYGFHAQANCGKIYYHINYRGANNLGFSDYDNGFTPAGRAQTAVDDINPGCIVSDDWRTPLGELTEPLLATALAYRADDNCPNTTPAAPAMTATTASAPWSPRLPTTLGRPQPR